MNLSLKMPCFLPKWSVCVYRFVADCSSKVSNDEALVVSDVPVHCELGLPGNLRDGERFEEWSYLTRVRCRVWLTVRRKWSLCLLWTVSVKCWSLGWGSRFSSSKISKMPTNFASTKSERFIQSSSTGCQKFLHSGVLKGRRVQKYNFCTPYAQLNQCSVEETQTYTVLIINVMDLIDPQTFSLIQFLLLLTRHRQQT